MLHISNSIAVHVLQIPNDQNGKNAIVYATLVIPDGRVVSDICSVSPRSPFEKEDPLEIAKNKVITLLNKKLNLHPKPSNSPLEMPFRMIKANSKGEEITLRLTNRFFVIQKLAEENGKDAKQLCLAKFGKSLSA
mgnify:CR=1 FL=1